MINPEQVFMQHHDFARQALQALDAPTAREHFRVVQEAYREIERERLWGVGKEDTKIFYGFAQEDKKPNYHALFLALEEDCDHYDNIHMRALLRREGWSEKGINRVASRQRGLNEIIRFFEGDPRPQEMPDID